MQGVDSGNERDLIIKFKPALVLHVLHFIGDFFYKTRASLARAAFNQEGRESAAGMAQVTSLPTPQFPHPQIRSLMDGVGVRESRGGEGGHLSRSRYRLPALLIVK